MTSLDDEGDFAWTCAWCGRGLNVRWLVDVIKVRVSDYFRVDYRLDASSKEWTFCCVGCRNAAWYGP